jgi:hypothetical protein
MGVHSVWGVERPDPTKEMRESKGMGLSLDGGAEGLCKPETRQCARFGVCLIGVWRRSLAVGMLRHDRVSEGN